MAEILQPGPVKLIAGLLAGRAEWLDAAAAELAERFGPTDVVSADIPFTFTHYYDSQMGSPLWRRLLAFERLAAPDALPEAKRQTNALEADLARRFSGPPRPVNIDPGYLTLSKLVLASAKDFSHRAYLTDGIYAEVTLQYRGGQWRSGEWTFPDYRSGVYDAFLSRARDRLKQQTG